MFTFSNKSMEKLAQVHPDLVKVMEAAITISTVDFGINEGVRTIEAQKAYFDAGKSKTMDSMHLLQEDGSAHAVDIFVLNKGIVTYEPRFFRPAIQSIITAAIEEEVQITVGMLWLNFVDSPHIELNQKYYSKKK